MGPPAGHSILISNDDGIGSPGLRALAEGLDDLGEVTVVAPDRERSAIGHALTLSRPLRARQLQARWYSVDGTPTDCVTLAVMGLMARRPDLIVAGINLGSNLGDDVTYSGTVSAAMEGTLLGIPAFAISLDGEADLDFGAASAFARHLAREILARGLPAQTLLNVNVPNLRAGRIRGVAITRQGRRLYRETVVEKVDPRGRAYYWIGGQDPTWEAGEGSDFEMLTAGYISVTPLHLDLTNYRALEELRGWGLDLNGARRPRRGRRPGGG